MTRAGRRAGRVSAVVLVALAVVVGAGTVWFRAVHKSWAWWRPPPVLTVLGRHYDGPGFVNVSMAEERRLGDGVWRRIGTELPMGWDIYGSVLPATSRIRAVPTVIFLRTGSDIGDSCSLSGGP